MAETLVVWAQGATAVKAASRQQLMNYFIEYIGGTVDSKPPCLPSNILVLAACCKRNLLQVL